MLCNLTNEWYLCRCKHGCYKSQFISKYLFPWKRLSFEEEFNSQFSNLIIAVNLQILSVFGSKHWESHRWDFFQNHWKILVKDFIFGNVASYIPAILLKKKLFLRHFSRILLRDSVGKITEQLFWRNLFQSKHFRPENFTSGVSRTLATFKMEFLVTLAVG